MMIIFPDWTPFLIGIYVVFAVFALSFGFLDYSGRLVLRYSKFGLQQGIPSRVGMFILYFVPLIAATVAAVPYLANATLVQWMVYGSLLFHFGKRVLEVLFLHKYSGAMDMVTMLTITMNYSLVAAVISWLNADPLLEVDALFLVGILLFLVGQGGNFYHHKLLADLRRDKSGYHIPEGGWFNGATCPHYFFELLAWFGVFLLSRHLYTLLSFVAMVGYLISRSLKTKAWYQEKFANYPDYKLMIPRIF